jgi:hypothetical protein
MDAAVMLMRRLVVTIGERSEGALRMRHLKSWLVANLQGWYCSGRWWFREFRYSIEMLWFLLQRTGAMPAVTTLACGWNTLRRKRNNFSTL